MPIVAEAESVWAPDTFWNFVNDIGSYQKKAVITLLENRGMVRAADLAKGIGIGEGALGGVLSGLSKQLKQLELKPYDLYWVHTDWTNGERKRTFFLQRAFRLAAEEAGWPRKGKTTMPVVAESGTVKRLAKSSDWRRF